ncbi:MAG TPA: hypothetical protein VJ250_05735 [Nitrososphaeraceae archaeon]|nr:hypothetical protein [Nitrososphaeraceae archaeon]
MLKTPHVFIVGFPTEHPDVVEANLRYQTRRKNRLKIMRAAMMSFEMTSNLLQALDSMDSYDAKEEEQQEQNNSELGEES